MQIKNAQANSFGPLAIDWLLWMQHKPSARWSDFDWQLYGRNQEILVQKQQEKPLKVSCCSYSSVQWTWAVCLVRTAAAQNNNHSSNNRERENSRLAVRETRTRQLLSWIEFQLDSLYIVMSQQHQMPRSHTHSYTGPAVCVWWSGTCWPHMSHLLLLYELMWSETHRKIRITHTQPQLWFCISKTQSFIDSLHMVK